MIKIQILFYLILGVLIVSTHQSEFTSIMKEMRNNMLNLTKNYFEKFSNMNIEKNTTKNISKVYGAIKKSNSNIPNEIFYLIEDKLRNSGYDFENRFFLLNKFSNDNKNEMEMGKEILSYEILHYRAYAKHDSGVFSSYMILMAFKNRIEIYDLYNHLLAHRNFDFEINDVITFKNQEGNKQLISFKSNFII